VDFMLVLIHLLQLANGTDNHNIFLVMLNIN
jgi:hypothetical protein